MIKADLHTHTSHSHGANLPAEIYAAAQAHGLDYIGFSEHSPRPQGFDYRNEYREKLSREFPRYLDEVRALRGSSQKNASYKETRALLGLEMDWLEGELEFTARQAHAEDYDYLIGSVHFIGHWGFDDESKAWTDADQNQCEQWYRAYFTAWRDMLASGLFQIAAHPDLIKIFSVEQFHIWLVKDESQAQIRACLRVLREKGMALEVSSAGLRKPCREIYPCPMIMALAAQEGLAVSFASDAHVASDVAFGFPRLYTYARTFGFQEQTVFIGGKRLALAL